MKKYWLPLLAIVLFSCEKNPEDAPIKPAKYNVSGKVEKGPFVSGSTLNLQPLDATYKALGTNFHSEIVDNAGNFSLGEMTLDTPYAVMTANGYFYNEVTNQLSNGTLTLNAIVDLRNKSSVNVNILTHLKYYRVQKLLSIGQTFAEADKQAQEELMRAFGLEKYNTSDFSQFSIVAGTDQAAALISISALLLIDRKEAALTEYLATLSKEFGDDGFFSVYTKDIMEADRYKLMDKLETISKNIEEKYSSLDQKVTVKDLAYFYDWDGDGVAGNEIADAGSVQLEATSLQFPATGGTKKIKVTSPITLSLSQHSGGGTTETSPISSDNFYDQIFKAGPIRYEAKLEGDELVVTVQPTTDRIVYGSTINFYDYLNKVVASVSVTQEGSQEGELFSQTADQYFAAIASRIGYVQYEYLRCDLSYSQVYSFYTMTPPLNPNDSNVRSLWSKCYLAINAIDTLIDYFEKLEGDLRAGIEPALVSLYTMRSLIYYKLMSFWSSVPYITPEMRANMQFSTTQQSDIIAAIKVLLDSAIEKLPQKKYALQQFNSNSFLNLTKDVPRFIMAKIYLMIGDYQNAKIYLDPVVAGGLYSMETHELKNGVTIGDFCPEAELIWGYQYTLTKSDVECIPILTYVDALLDMCEINLNLGDYNKAQMYMNVIRVAYSQTQETWSSPEEFLNEIYYWRQKSINCRGEYFDFLRRTGLAKSLLGLADYQLLFPVPAQEVMSNPDITQNPGY